MDPIEFQSYPSSIAHKVQYVLLVLFDAFVFVNVRERIQMSTRQETEHKRIHIQIKVRLKKRMMDG